MLIAALVMASAAGGKIGGPFVSAMPVNTRLASSATQAPTTAQTAIASAPAPTNSSASSGLRPKIANPRRTIAHTKASQNPTCQKMWRDGGNATRTFDRAVSRSAPRWASTEKTANTVNATSDLIQSIDRRARGSFGAAANTSKRPGPTALRRPGLDCGTRSGSVHRDQITDSRLSPWL